MVQGKTKLKSAPKKKKTTKVKPKQSSIKLLLY